MPVGRVVDLVPDSPSSAMVSRPYSRPDRGCGRAGGAPARRPRRRDYEQWLRPYPVAPDAPPPGDGQRRGERLAQPPGGRAEGQRLHPEPLWRCITGSSWSGIWRWRGVVSWRARRCRGGVDAGEGAGGAGPPQWGGVGGRAALRERPEAHGGSTAACTRSGFQPARADRA